MQQLESPAGSVTANATKGSESLGFWQPFESGASDFQGLGQVQFRTGLARKKSLSRATEMAQPQKVQEPGHWEPD